MPGLPYQPYLICRQHDCFQFGQKILSDGTNKVYYNSTQTNLRSSFLPDGFSSVVFTKHFLVQPSLVKKTFLSCTL